MDDRTVDQDQADQLRHLYDATVYGQDGEKLGGISQIYLDDRSGQPSWATVSTGWFGTRETFVPLDDAHVAADRIDVPYSKEFVKDAPQVDADHHLDEAQEAELYRYYSKSYDEGIDDDRRVGAAGAAGVAGVDAGRGQQDVAGRDRGVLDRDRDLADGDLRDRDLGDRDLGDRDLGDRDRGDRDLGDGGRGDRDLGDRGLGDRDHGDRDFGDRDLRDRDRDHDLDASDLDRGLADRQVAGRDGGRGRMRLRRHTVRQESETTVPVERDEPGAERRLDEGDGIR